jgi:hypothetical protein
MVRVRVRVRVLVRVMVRVRVTNRSAFVGHARRKVRVAVSPDSQPIVMLAVGWSRSSMTGCDGLRENNKKRTKDENWRF